MAQKQAWEKEYKSPKLLTKNDKPQNYVLRFLKVLKKHYKVDITNLKVLDLGSGVGRNSNYLAQKGNEVIGLEISQTAIKTAELRASEANLDDKVSYIQQNIGQIYDLLDNDFDLVLDIMSTTTLNESERNIYLLEVNRVLKPGGFFLVRALRKEGDKNAKNLIKISPGAEPDTYYMKELDLTERVFSEKDFRELYGKNFRIDTLINDIGYAKVGERIYQRHYWIAYLRK